MTQDAEHRQVTCTIRLSMKELAMLEELRLEWGMDTRGKVLESILKSVLNTDP